MKKFILLIVVAISLMVACNTKPTSTQVTGTDSTATKPSTTTSTPGQAAMPAQVFEELSGSPILGATVAIKEGSKAVETDTTDAKGIYYPKLLVPGHTYLYTVAKTGYTSQSKTAAYKDPSGLPYFGLK